MYDSDEKLDLFESFFSAVKVEAYLKESTLKINEQEERKKEEENKRKLKKEREEREKMNTEKTSEIKKSSTILISSQNTPNSLEATSLQKFLDNFSSKNVGEQFKSMETAISEEKTSTEKSDVSRSHLPSEINEVSKKRKASEFEENERNNGDKKFIPPDASRILNDSNFQRSMSCCFFFFSFFFLSFLSFLNF